MIQREEEVVADRKRLGGEPQKKKEQYWVLAHGARQGGEEVPEDLS